MDEIMIKIKENKDNYSYQCEDAVIEENFIIPGVNGREVNVDKSYYNMKQIGMYNDDYYVYDEIIPNVSLTKNKSFYIKQGNSKQRSVSLIFILSGDDDISKLLSIIKKDEISVNFFVDEKWMDNNNSIIENLINSGHIIGIYDDSEDSIRWIDTIIKKIGKQQSGYCLLDTKEQSLATNCNDLNNYLISKQDIIFKSPLKNVKNQVNSGSIILFDFNNELMSELSSVISYIKSKGFHIKNLEEHLSEKSR